MKKEVKALIKRLTLIVDFYQTGTGWIAINGDGVAYQGKGRPAFDPSGIYESLDKWVFPQEDYLTISNLDEVPLAWVCPSLTCREALFYTDGATVWLVEV